MVGDVEEGERVSPYAEGLTIFKEGSEGSLCTPHYYQMLETNVNEQLR